MKNEFALIDSLKKMIPRHLQGALGIGDDAGMLRWGGGHLFASTDSIVEGVDFKWGQLAPEWVGRKALAINLSDMAAMGAEPLGFVVSLGISRRTSEAWIRKFYRGMMRLAGSYGVHCLGGDLSRAKQFFASIAVFGKAGASEFVRRRGAKAGHLIAVTGHLGGSIRRHHYQFEPRIREAQFLARHFHPTAMMDISDGLLQDLGHILKASKVGARLDLGQIPVSQDAVELSRKDSYLAMEHALTDGEDFELLFTVDPASRKNLERAWRRWFPRVPLSWIGVIRSGEGKVSWMFNQKPVKAPALKKKGFRHF